MAKRDDVNLTSTFRALCAELLDEAIYLGQLPYEQDPGSELVDRARAALAQPEPEPPTDEELLRAYGLAKRDHCYEGPIDDWPKRAERAATVHGLHAILSLWGRPSIKPVPVSEGLPKAEYCDAQGNCWLTNDSSEPGWVLDNPEKCTNWTHWVPHWAMPIVTK